MADLISQQGLYQDGNSIFENVHILGTLNVTGIVNTETTVKASKFIGDGSELTGIDATTIKDSAGTIRIQGTTTGATHSGRAVFTEVEITGKLYDGVTGEMGSAGKVLSSTGSQLEWINTSAANVGSATNVGVNLDSTDASQFVSFVGANSGNQPTRVNNSFRYNPSSNTIATIKINDLQVVGQLKDGEGNFGASGTVLTSDGTDTAWENVGTLAAGSAAKLSVSEDDTETDGRLLFSNAAGQSGGNVIKSDNDLTYNANTNTLTVNNVSGTATQAANLNNHDTDDLSEGSSNLYFTNGRARAAISVGAEGSPSGDGSISYNNSTGVLTFTPAAAAGTPTAITVADESSDTTCFPLFATAATGDLAPKTGSNLTFNSSDGTLTANNFSGGGANLSNLNADNLSSGTIPAVRLPNHSASLLTSGTIPAARLPNHSASLLTSGTIPDARISGNFLRSNTDDSMSGLLTLNKSANRVIVLDRNISSPSNYFNDLQMEVRATNGTAGIGLHRSGYSHVGIYHDASGSVKFNMNNGTATLNGTTGTVWGSGNDGSGSGLDADVLRGAAPNVSASNNTIVQRHSSGYIFANYFNTTANDVGSGVTKVMVETNNDNYIRHGTAAAVRSFLNVADGANNITNTNQLTNGAGFITGTDVRSMNEAASTGQSTSTSNSNTTKVTLSINTVSNSRVLVNYAFEIAHSDTSNKSCIATVEGTNVSFVGSRSESNRSTAFALFHGSILDIGSHTGTRSYRIVFRRSTSGGSVRIRNAYLTAIEMSV